MSDNRGPIDGPEDRPDSSAPESPAADGPTAPDPAAHQDTVDPLAETSSAPVQPATASTGPAHPGEPDRSDRSAELLAGGRTTVAAALIALLLLIGAGAAGFALASGGDDDRSDRSSQRGDSGRDNDDGDGDGDGDGEQPLTGDTLAQVAEAVEAEYPGATIDRAETDDDGVYEAHITTTDGDELTVELDTAFAITGTEDD